jgi:hypothetical protein
MKEYQITVHGLGGLYFRTEWLEFRSHAEKLAADFTGLYGEAAVELVARTTTRKGITFETLIECQPC